MIHNTILAEDKRFRIVTGNCNLKGLGGVELMFKIAFTEGDLIKYLIPPITQPILHLTNGWIWNKNKFATLNDLFTE